MIYHHRGIPKQIRRYGWPPLEIEERPSIPSDFSANLLEKTVLPPLVSFDLELQHKVAQSCQELEPYRHQFVSPRPEPQWICDAIDFKHMARLVDISAPTEVISHRPLVGWLIVVVKKLAMAAAQPLIKVLLRRQIELNEYLFHTAIINDRLVKRVSQLEAELKLTAPKHSDAL